jgi:hypothetical protein
MSSLVNELDRIAHDVKGSGLSFCLAGDVLHVKTTGATASFKVARLYRPASADVISLAGPETILILEAPSQKAIAAAEASNHIILPGGGYRIVAPGIAIARDISMPITFTRQVKLTGRTGVIAESMLLAPQTTWSVAGLAATAGVSPALVHRAFTRLEGEDLVEAHGQGREKIRTLRRARALAELWAHEERIPKPTLRGYLYGSNPNAVVHAILEALPGGAVGGVLAANSYRPTLTRDAPPYRVWIPDTFNIDPLLPKGFEETEEGANLELIQVKDDPWAVHVDQKADLPRVSKWRAWLEIDNISGRTEELADAMLKDLKEDN